MGFISAVVSTSMGVMTSQYDMFTWFASTTACLHSCLSIPTPWCYPWNDQRKYQSQSFIRRDSRRRSIMRRTKMYKQCSKKKPKEDTAAYPVIKSSNHRFIMMWSQYHLKAKNKSQHDDLSDKHPSSSSPSWARCFRSIQNGILGTLFGILLHPTNGQTSPWFAHTIQSNLMFVMAGQPDRASSVQAIPAFQPEHPSSDARSCHSLHKPLS